MTQSAGIPTGAVVAVFDDRGFDVSVIETAAQEAARRCTRLRLVHVDPGSVSGRRFVTGAVSQMATDWARPLRTRWPDVDVEVVATEESRADVLAEAGSDAGLLVISRAEVADVLVSAGCPALVVQDLDVRRAPQRLVEAAVHGQPGDTAVIQEAADEAWRRGCELRLVHAYQPLPVRQAATDRAHRYVLNMLSDVHLAPGLEANTVCAAGEMVHVLTQHPAGAELVVMDGGFVGAREVEFVMRRCGSSVLLLRQAGTSTGRRRACIEPAAHRRSQTPQGASS